MEESDDRSVDYGYGSRNTVDEESHECASSVDLFDIEKYCYNVNNDDVDDVCDKFAEGSNVIAQQILHSLHGKDKIISQLTKELEEEREKHNSSHIVESWQIKYKRLEGKCNNLTKQLKETKKEHEREREEQLMELIEMKKSSAECDLEHQEVINTLSAKIHELESNEQRQLSVIEREREYYKSEIEQLRLLLQIKKKNTSNNKVEQVNCSNKESSSNSVIDYNVSYEMMHNDLVAQENACVKLQSEVCSLRSHVSQQLASIAELTLHNQELENKLKHYMKISKEEESQVEILTIEKDKLTEEINTLKREKECKEQWENEQQQEEEEEEENILWENQETNKSEQNNNNTVEEVCKVEHTIQDSHRIERLVLASEQKRVDAEAQVTALTNENEQLQSELRAQRVCFRNEMLEQQTMCNALVTQWQGKLEESVHNLNEMTRQYELMQNELHDLKVAYNETCITLDNTQSTLDEMMNQKNDVEDEVRELQESINVLESKLSTEVNNNNNLKRQITELSAEEQHNCTTLQHMEHAFRDNKTETRSFLKSLHVALSPLEILLIHKNANSKTTSVTVSEEEFMQGNHNKEENEVFTSETSSSEESNYDSRANNIDFVYRNSNINKNNSKSNHMQAQHKETLKWIRKLVQHAKHEIIDKHDKITELKSKVNALQTSHKREMVNEIKIMNSKMNKMHSDHVEEMATLEKKYKELCTQWTNYKKHIQQSAEEERLAQRKEMEMQHAEWKEKQRVYFCEWNINKCDLVASNLLKFVKEIIDLINHYKSEVQTEQQKLIVTNTDQVMEWQVSDNIVNECDEITQSILGLQGGWKELTSLIADQRTMHELNNRKINYITEAAIVVDENEYKMLHQSITKILRVIFDVSTKSDDNHNTNNKVTCVPDDTTSLSNTLIQFIMANIK